MKVAVIQHRGIFDNWSGAVEAAIVQHMRWATVEAIDLIVFPEAFLLGHSYNPETIRARAREASKSALADLCKLVASFQVTLVVGAFEMVQGYIFNSAFVIEGGRIVGRYAKAHPNEPGVSAGHDFPTFVRSGLRYGINICNDANHTESAKQIACQNADLILYPLNNMLRPEIAEHWREKSLVNLMDRARQNGCWIASSDVTGTANGMQSYGCTVIVAPTGEVVARVAEFEEGVAVYDVPARQL